MYGETSEIKIRLPKLFELVVFILYFIIIVCKSFKERRDNLDSQIFGDTLRKLRIDNDLTQEELGKVIGVTRKSIQNYEKGIQFPEVPILIKIARHFHVSIEYLTGETKIATTLQEIEKGLEIDNLSLKYDDILSLSDEDKKLLILLVNRLKEKFKNKGKH